MAYFKLTLLTPYSSADISSLKDVYNSIYFEDIITEFYPQIEAYKTTQNHPAFDDDQELIESSGSALLDHENKQLLSLEEHQHPIEGYSFSDSNYSLTERKSSTAFSYGEKITFSQNAQKTLSFSMNRYVIRENERVENPFVNLIQSGSQLLLTDQYGNEYFFTVTNIKYTIKETNIIYDYTCQDSFTYQTSRQNQNYFIDNDPTSADFIGPKTADWWIVHKVVPECYLTNYSYIPCSRALYESTNGNYYVCDNLSNKRDVKRIIKEPHTFDEESYYTTFAYSCSGQNAASTLIDIASKINMQLKTFEHSKQSNNERTKYFNRYFWIEPLKNDQRIGLIYSPRRDIQSFDLTHNGQSLTTMLTVSGPTYNDEIITLIPDIPLFFHNFFLRPDWDKVGYSSGMFTQACSGESYIGNKNFDEQDLAEQSNRFYIDTDRSTEREEDHRIEIEDENEHIIALLFPIYNQNKLFNFNIDLYEHFSFFSKEDTSAQQSQIQFSVAEQDSIITTTPRSEAWVLAQEKENISTDITGLDKYNLYYPGQSFENEIDRTKPLFLCLLFNNPLTNSISSINYAQVYIRFFRDVSQEELEFATIADKCPWLENKIIDFTYFYKQNIISRKEYNALINILYNDLRKVNGKLIYYTQAYYKAIHDKTEMLANLTNQLDSLGAAAQAAIVDPLATTGKVKDLSYFENAYNTVFNTGEQEIMGLLNYNTIVSDYFTKYFNAEQRFLKNVYNFRKYFNAENPLKNQALYHYTLTLTQPTWQGLDWSNKDGLPQAFYGFSDNKFISLTNTKYPYIYYSGCKGADVEDDTTPLDYGRPFLTIFNNENGRLSVTPVASRDKWLNDVLYRYPLFKGEEKFCSYQARYNEEQRYLKLIFKMPIHKDSSGNYYWIANNRQRKIAASSSRNYKEEDLTNFDNNTLLYGFYRIRFYWAGAHWWAYCKAERVQKEGKQNYIYLSLLHQSEWYYNNGHQSGKVNIDILTKLFNDPNNPLSFEKQSYFEMPTEVSIEAVYYNGGTYSSEYYSSVYFHSGSTTYAETYYPTAGDWTEEEDIPKEYVGLVHASVQDLKDNWFYTHYNNTTAFIKSKPNYKIFNQDSVQNSFKTMKEWATLQMFVFAARGLSAEEIAEKNKDFDDGTAISSGLFEDWAEYLYKNNFPVTDFYSKTPRYRVSQIEEDNYIFERLNEKNQSFSKYVEYIFNTSDFALPAVENPYSFVEYQKLNFVNKENESQYYRRVMNHPNAGIATGLGIAGAGVFIFGPAAPWAIPMFLAQSAVAGAVADAYAGTQQHWATSGVTSRDFYGEKLSNDGKTRFSGYWKNNEGKTIYATTENSFSLYNDYVKAFKNNFYNSSSVTISSVKDWERIKDLVWESADLYITGDGKPYITLKRPKTATPFYYALLDQHVGYDLSSLETRSTNSIDMTVPNVGTIKLVAKDAYFIDKTVKPLILSNIINKNDSLFMLWVGSSTTNIIINDAVEFKKFLNKGSFSGSYYYPLVNNFQKINISSLDWKDQESFTLEEVITNGDRWSIDMDATDGHYIKMDQNKTELSGYAIFFLVKDYKEQSLSNYYGYPDNISRTQPRLFNKVTLTDFDFLKQDDIVKGFYIDVNLATDRVPAKTVESDFNIDNAYYNADGIRIYTIPQLKERGSYVYLHNFVYDKDDVGSNIDTFNISLSKYSVSYDRKDEESNYYISSITEEPLNDVYQIKFDLISDNIEPYPSISASKDLSINNDTSLHIDLSGTFTSQIEGLSNGTFWYLYHTSVNIPVLFSTAAAIEAELTGYWNEAYTASKFCEYFFPESWTPTSNQKDNLFSQAIFTISTEEKNNITTYKALLLNNFLPEVNIIRDESGKTVLKRYQYTFETDPIDSIEHLFNTRYVLEDQEEESISSTTIIQNNFAIRNAMKIIYNYNDEEVINAARKWKLTEIGKTTYYYSEVGGTSWAELVQQHVSSSAFTEFNGWYIMALRWLKRHYQNWTLSEYEEAKQEHDAIWNKLYQQFGHILLENTFKSDTATSSIELLNEALLQFKDRASPERQYSITVIDTASLENYSGAEIRVGDGIQVKATDYYDQQDLIYDSLTQYLFITDINYTLRDATNFSLTVNDVKYSDTIVKRLAKLIK